MSKGFCRPDLFEIQLLSYSKLLQKGLLEELTKLSPIKRLTVDRVGPHICYDIGRNLFIRILPQTLRIVADNNSDEKHSIKSRQTYVLDVYVGMQIVFEGTVQGKLQFIYLGQIPRMTSQGGFIHNGLKKTIISQLVRSPGIYFNTESQINPDLMPKRIATLIPNYGSWLKFEHKIDKNENETIMVQVNQTEKMPALEFLMALGFSQEKLYELIPILRDMAWKREGKNESGIIVKPIYEREILANSTTQALQQIQTFINPESVPTPLEIRESLWHQFRDPKYYDLGVMGRIQLDQKLDFGGRLPKARLFNTLIQWNNLLGSHVNAPSRSTPTFRSSFEERRGLFRKAISPEGSPLRESEGRKAIVATTSWFQLARSAETLEHFSRPSCPEGTSPVPLVPTLVPKEPLSSRRDERGSSVSVGNTWNQEGCAATPEGADEHRQEQQVPLEPTATSSRTLALTGDTKGLVPIRCKQEFLQTYITQVDFLSLSPIQMISVATSLIPFLEHDDANRALMGSNMQRQSVPLVKPERPIVGTGFEGKVARDSRYVLTAGSTGIITQADSQVICLTQYLKKNVMPSLLRSCLNKKRKDLFEYSIEKKVRKFHSKLCHKRVLRSNIYRNLSSYSQALKPISPRVPRTNWEIYSKKSIFRRRAKVRSLFSFRLVTFSFILLHLEISYPFIWLIWLNYVRYTRLFATVSRPPARSASFGTQNPSIRSFATPGALRANVISTRSAPGSVGGSLSTKGIIGGKGSSGLTSLPVGSSVSEGNTERSPVPLGQPEGADELSSRREEWLRADGTTVKTWDRGKELVSNLIKITTIYNLASFERSNQKTLVNQKPIVYRGEWVKQNGILADGASTCGGELALGKNVLVAYMPWEGYNFEDAILISDRLIREDIYTSIYIDKYEFQIPEKIPPDFIVATLDFTCITRDFSHIPYITEFDLRNLDDSGIIKVGSWVKPGDILIGRIKSAPFLNYYYPGLSTKRQQKPGLIGTKKKISPQKFTTKSLDDLIHWKKGFTDVSYRVPSLVKGRIVDVKFLTETSIQISIAQSRKIQVGDKLAGRHGNKGIVSKILPQQHMPCLQNGTPIDMVLSPLGVPSRMNVGQIFECLFGLAGKYLREHYKVLPFDEMYGKEASRSLVYHKLYEARKKTGYSWLFEPNSPGKSYIFDGRTATVFQQPVTVGYPYMLKLIHQVQDKLHARHIGPYATKTQQPLRGKRNQGGQRLGEMEVWALEAFGASYILQEMLTLKADSIVERKKISHTISQGDFIKKKEFSQKLKSVFVDPNSTRRMEDTSSSPTEGEPKERRRFSLVEHWDPLPEAFKLLIYELRVLCFEIQLEPIKSDIITAPPSDRFLLGTESKFQHRGSNSNDLENVDFKMLEKYMIKKDWL